MFRYVLIMLIDYTISSRGFYVGSFYLEDSEPKWVNPDDISYEVKSLRVGGLYI